MTDEKVSFKNQRGMEIKGILSYPESKNQLPAVAVSHGFLSYKENKLLYMIARKLEESGFASLRFDFSGCIGESEGACEDMMLSHQVDDLISAINFMSSDSRIKESRIGLVGHSLGGLTSIIVASNDKRVKSLVSIAAPAKLEWQNLIKEDFVRMWEHDKKAKFRSDRKGEIEIDFSFYKDFKEYDGEKIIRNLAVPIRIIHGNEDNIVPVKNANSLFDSAGSKKDIQIINGADHLLLEKGVLTEVAEMVGQWFESTLT